MNKVVLMGRLTRDPVVRYSAGENSMAIARFTLAVDRRFRKEGEAATDFIDCVSFGKIAEFAEKYYHQGIKILITGRIQTGSYTNREGQKVYTTEVVIEEQEFAESKAVSEGNNTKNNQANNQGVPNYQNDSQRQNQGKNQNRNAGNNSNGSKGYGNNSSFNGSYNNFPSNGEFMNIPDSIDEELPFN